ncbi:MAG: hypothetical protein KAG14_05230, partial [Mycoplasmataceae bacterium]|nr:hypothetical protein [Mycoplasmataceae bacterium]
MKKLGGLSLRGLYKEFAKIVKGASTKTADGGHINYSTAYVADDIFDSSDSKIMPQNINELAKKTTLSEVSVKKLHNYIKTGKKSDGKKWKEKEFIRNLMIPTSADIHPSNLGYETIGNYLFEDINRDMGRNDAQNTFKFIYRNKITLENDLYKSFWNLFEKNKEEIREIEAFTYTDIKNKEIKWAGGGDFSGTNYPKASVIKSLHPEKIAPVGALMENFKSQTGNPKAILGWNRKFTPGVGAKNDLFYSKDGNGDGSSTSSPASLASNPNAVIGFNKNDQMATGMGDGLYYRTVATGDSSGKKYTQAQLDARTAKPIEELGADKKLFKYIELPGAKNIWGGLINQGERNIKMVEPEFLLRYFSNKYKINREKFRASHNNVDPTYKEMQSNYPLSKEEEELQKMASLLHFNNSLIDQNDIFASDVDPNAMASGSLTTIPFNLIVDSLLFDKNKVIVHEIMVALKLDTLESLFELISGLDAEKIVNLISERTEGEQIGQVLSGLMLAIHNYRASKGMANLNLDFNDLLMKKAHTFNAIVGTNVAATGDGSGNTYTKLEINGDNGDNKPRTRKNADKTTTTISSIGIVGINKKATGDGSGLSYISNQLKHPEKGSGAIVGSNEKAKYTYKTEIVVESGNFKDSDTELINAWDGFTESVKKGITDAFKQIKKTVTNSEEFKNLLKETKYSAFLNAGA